MKIVFMGTPAFAVVSLNRLIQSRHEILAVVTVPDKPQGRGQKMMPSPVKIAAEENHLPVYQPKRLEEPGFLEELRKLNADVFVVVAFKILPRSVFSIPRQGTINLHASLLPKYRGAAPIHWAIMNGEKETGVTTIRIDEKVDTGAVLMQKRTGIEPEMTAGELHDQLAELGSQLLVETLNKMEDENIELLPQDNTKATKAPKLKREMTRLDFDQPVEIVHDKIRGLSPYPGGFCFHRDKMIKVIRSTIKHPDRKQSKSGTVVDISKNSFSLQCARGIIEVLSVQPEGKKIMSAGAYINGTHLEIGEEFT